jgi:hypothetical protein
LDDRKDRKSNNGAKLAATQHRGGFRIRLDPIRSSSNRSSSSVHGNKTQFLFEEEGLWHRPTPRNILVRNQTVDGVNAGPRRQGRLITDRSQRWHDPTYFVFGWKRKEKKTHRLGSLDNLPCGAPPSSIATRPN